MKIDDFRREVHLLKMTQICVAKFIGPRACLVPILMWKSTAMAHGFVWCIKNSLRPTGEAAHAKPCFGEVSAQLEI